MWGQTGGKLLPCPVSGKPHLKGRETLQAHWDPPTMGFCASKTFRFENPGFFALLYCYGHVIICITVVLRDLSQRHKSHSTRHNTCRLFQTAPSLTHHHLNGRSRQKQAEENTSESISYVGN